MKVSIVDLIVIAVYLVLMMIIGVVFQRFNRNADDFVRSGCKATWWLTGASCFMSIFSAWTFTGGAGVAYEAGWSFTILFVMNAVGFAVQGLFLAPWFRQLRAVSVPEVIRRRFDVNTQQFIAYLGMLTGVFGAAITLYGLAVFTSAMTGFDVRAIIVALGFVVVFYSFTSGSWAVMATDFIQAIVLFPVTLLITFLALYKVGGLGGLETKIAEMGLTNHFRLFNTKEFAGQMNDFTMFWAVGIFLGKSVEFIGMGASRRYFTVKDGREASKAAFLAAVLMIAGAFLWAIPPMVARLFFADKVMASGLANPIEASYAVICAEFLPQGLIGLVLVAMFSATMSSMDVGLNSNAAIIINDAYPALCRRLGWQQRQGAAMVRFAKVWTLILGAIIILLALNFSQLKGVGMFRLMLELSAIFGSVIGVPMVLGLFLKKTPPWAASFTIMIGAIPSTLGFLSGSTMFAGLPLLATPWNYQVRVIVNIVVTTAVFLLSMRFYRPVETYRRQVEEFFTVMRTPVDFEKEIGGNVDISQLVIIGGFSMLTGLLIALLHLVPNLTWIDRGGITFVSVSILISGLLLFIAGKRSQRALRQLNQRTREENSAPLEPDLIPEKP